MTVAWVFPGQGSQKIGMAKQVENLPKTKERFSYASEVFERNLFEICELNTEPTNPLIDLNNTRNTQICLSEQLIKNYGNFFNCKFINFLTIHLYWRKTPT